MHAIVAVRAMGGVGFGIGDVGDALGSVIRNHGFNEEGIRPGQGVVGLPVLETDFRVGEKLLNLEQVMGSIAKMAAIAGVVIAFDAVVVPVGCRVGIQSAIGGHASGKQSPPEQAAKKVSGEAWPVLVFAAILDEQDRFADFHAFSQNRVADDLS